MSWRLWLGIGLGIGTDFQIVRDRDALTIRGRIARRKIGQLSEFLRHDLPPDVSFAVAGRFGRGRMLNLRWAGGLDQWSRQRVRNVLVEVLK
jgi:hypothetical protein